MMPKLRDLLGRRPAGGLLALALAAAPAWSAGRVADSPQDVRPLLIGAEVPAATVRSAAGKPVALHEVLAGTPSVVIFFRGGW